MHHIEAKSNTATIRVTSGAHKIHDVVRRINSTRASLRLRLVIRATGAHVERHTRTTKRTRFRVSAPTIPIVPHVAVRRSCSHLLCSALTNLCSRLNFASTIGSQIFHSLIVTHVVRPTSGLSAVHVLRGLKLGTPSGDNVRQSLGRTTSRSCQSGFTTTYIAFEKARRLALILCSIAALFFRIRQRSRCHGPNLSGRHELRPRVIIKLLISRHKFPLRLRSFRKGGTRALALIPILSTFQTRRPSISIDITYSTNVLSTTGLLTLRSTNCSFVIKSEVTGAPPSITRCRRSNSRLSSKRMFRSHR